MKIEIIKCLYKRNYFPESRLALEINVLSNPDRKHDINSSFGDLSAFYDRIIKDRKTIDEPGMDGITNMHLACESGNEDEVKFLLENGANPNQICHDDWTPLHVSSARGDTSIVKLLLKYGAISTANKHGIKPVDLAKEQEHEEIIALFRQ